MAFSKSLSLGNTLGSQAFRKPWSRLFSIQVCNSQASPSTGAKDSSKPKTAILMLNMGGPTHTDQVSEYLHRIMTDRDMIQLPVQGKLGPYIARRRTPEVQKKYQEIGGGSPILKWTQLQGEKMANKLNSVCPEYGPHKHYVAFRYADPLTEETLDQIEKDGAERVVIFSQYPQYSCATSGSSLNAIYTHLNKKGSPSNISWSLIDRWSTHPLLCKVFAERIQEELKQFPVEVQKDVIILFSAHSLPLRGKYYFVIQALVTLFARITKLGWFDSEKDEFVFRNVIQDVSNFLQVQKNSKVYRRLNEVLGLCDEATVLSVFVRKIITNLKYWGRSEQIITKTLQLLNDLSVGYSCVRKLVKLDEVQFMLNNHTNCLTFDFIGTATDESTTLFRSVQIPTSWRPAFLDPNTLKLFFNLYHSLPSTLSHLSEHFPFLGNNVADVSEMRCRSMFYTSLGRLLMVDLGEDEDRFEAFMLPLTSRLTWLVYIIGAAVGGRVSFNSNEDHDAMDGELVCRVLQLMNLTDPRLLGPGPGCEKLELAMLSFFEQFRKIYVGDQVRIFDLSIPTSWRPAFLDPNTLKLFFNLYHSLPSTLSHLALACLVQIASVRRSLFSNAERARFLTQLVNGVKQILQNPQGLSDANNYHEFCRLLARLKSNYQLVLQSEHFPFLGNNVADVSEMRCRSMFYTSLGRLLMVDLGEDEDRFEAFMLPLTRDLYMLVIRSKIDLNTKTSYMMLFDWIYPVYTPIFLAAVERWYAEPEVTTPILKLFAELVQNRSQRLQFDVSSPNGILLFREASKIICSYGSRILSVEVPDDKLYSHKLKGISICFSMLKAALCGGYVNFGVFRLYGDEALDNALKTFVKLLLSINQSDLLDYPKLSQTYYVLLECLAQDHMSFLASLEPTVFLYILSSISEGLTALDTMVCTGCCATLDHIVTYLFKQITNKGKKKSGRPGASPTGTDMFLQVLEVRPEILQQILSTVLNIIMFEDCRNQWSMSRPLLGLILLNEEYFNQLRENIVRGQPPDKQASMVQWFENLMNSIERNLLTKNRDR
ncbi:exportin-7-like [Diaphorina citri]|uniref:Ferrochelatase, mitochondrial n=1 Tax=Diaphorina citri TaxID=121845 RepID=A0A3Q0IJN6_DIACI|nr:exportin-7-like [Diaphorina citri]